MKPFIHFTILAFAVWLENHCSFDIEQILIFALP